MDTGDRIKARRKQLGYTLEQLGEMVGVSKGTIQRYEIDKIGLKRDIAIKLAKALQTTPAYLMGWEANLEIVTFTSSHTIPVVSNVDVGKEGELQVECVGYEIAYNLEDPEEYRYFKVKGNSMAPVLQDRDLALIHLQSDVNSGEMAVVITKEMPCEIRKVYKFEDVVSFVALNHEYESIILNKKDDYIIWGKVVQMTRKFT